MKIMMPQPQYDPRRVFWKDEDCERLRRSEFEAMRCLLGAESYAKHAAEDLQDRLKCIPGGQQRMAMLIGSIKAIVGDLVGTMTRNQCNQLTNTMKDYEIRMVPKLTGRTTNNVVFDKDIAQNLIDLAQERCRDCVEDGESCRKCPLYQTLEGILPMEEYSDLQCPYSRAEWE